jgi:hypothetical protein
MKVSTIIAKCRFWGHKFEMPSLGDFSYGDFIYSDGKGKKFKYFSGINNEYWDFVNQTLEVSRIKAENRGDAIQKIIGLIADFEESEGHYQNERVICPVCGKKVLHFNRDKIVSTIDIDELSFNRYSKLTTQEKENEILSLVNEINFLGNSDS